jgi:hypothetical protein
MPHLPVLTSYRRAWTISFGSVCLGSMFVAPVQTLHSVVRLSAVYKFDALGQLGKCAIPSWQGNCEKRGALFSRKVFIVARFVCR